MLAMPAVDGLPSESSTTRHNAAHLIAACGATVDGRG